MKKTNKVDLAIALALGRTPLCEESLSLLKELTLTNLVEKHSLNDIQARNVMLWCRVQDQRHWAQGMFNPNRLDEIDTDDVQFESPYSLARALGGIK
jgi:hypothetical protein